MSSNQIFVIIVFVLVLAGAGVAIYAAVRRRLQLMIVALGLMQILLGTENLRREPHWIAYLNLGVGASLLLMALIQRSRFQRSATGRSRGMAKTGRDTN